MWPPYQTAVISHYIMSHGIDETKTIAIIYLLVRYLSPQLCTLDANIASCPCNYTVTNHLMVSTKNYTTTINVWLTVFDYPFPPKTPSYPAVIFLFFCRGGQLFGFSPHRILAFFSTDS